MCALKKIFWINLCEEFNHIYFVFSLLFSGLLTSQREVAMISEMIHTASLVHDDVIDQPDFRRGKPSVNKVWNHKKVRAPNRIIHVT